ncbi:MAG TPA: phosphonate ABC transporter, permease protein PhnE, partial [Alphaproteobacteria bacterium]|nr:phosphonate ABC transporter, permease protein PhnE [Alphaproteobacteria bacterium]
MATATARFEAEYQTIRARALFWRAIVTVVIVALLLLSAYVSDFVPARLIDGLPKIGLFFENFLPGLRQDVLLEGERTEGSFLYWFYAWDIWGLALLTSINMAILATVASVMSGFALATLAARNLGVPGWLSFLAMRLADLLR